MVISRRIVPVVVPRLSSTVGSTAVLAMYSPSSIFPLATLKSSCGAPDVLSTPVVTADWTAERSNRWTIPVGGGAGKLFKIGSQPLNARTEFFNHVRTTTGGSDWQMQAQLQFLFIRHE